MLLIKKIKSSLFDVEKIAKFPLFEITFMVRVLSITLGNTEGFLVLAEAIYLSICNTEESSICLPLTVIRYLPRNISREHLLVLIHVLMDCNKDAGTDILLYNDDTKTVFRTFINCTN